MKRKSFKSYTMLITLSGFLVFLFQTALGMDIINVIMPTIESDRGWSRGELNTVISAATLVGIAAPFIFGTIYLKFGLQKILFISMLVNGIATIVMGVTDTMVVFAACTFIVQFISMALTIGIVGIIGNWFLKTKGRILGIVTIAAPFSTAAFTPFATYLLVEFGFTGMFVIIGVLGVVLGAGSVLFIPSNPEEVGLHIDNETDAQKEEEIKIESKWTVGRLLKTKETWLLIVGFGLVYVMMTSIMSQFVARMTDQGITPDVAIGMLSIAAVAGMPFSYFWGWLDDKISTPKTSGIFLLTYVITAIAMIFAGKDNMAAVYLAGFAVAATTGGMINLIPSSITWVFGGHEYVNANRTISTFQLIGRSIAFYLMGAIYTNFGSYTVAYYIFIPLAIIGSICLFSIRRSYDPLNPKFVGIPFDEEKV